MPYFEVPDGFGKRPCDAGLVFCSWVLDRRTKTFEKTEGDLLRKCLYINKELQEEIRSGNSIIFNFMNLGNVSASKETKRIICIAFFCSKFMQCLKFRFWPHAGQTYERWEWKIAYQIDLIVATLTVSKFTKHSIGFE